MYYLSIFIAVLGGVIYHASMKVVPKTLNPFFSLAVIYFFAFVLSFIAMLFSTDGSRSLQDVSLRLLAPAIGVFGVELGFLLAYRVGWNVGYTSLVANGLCVLALLPISVLVMHQGLSFQKVAGIIVTFIGMALLIK